jgi:hypothetical protein
MKIKKSLLKKIIREVMGSGFSYGQGLGIGKPSTANAVELSGGPAAPVLGYPEIAEIKEEVTAQVMEVLKDYVTNMGDAYELLSIMTQDLEDKMAQEGYADSESELERYLPLEERRKRRKGSS